MGEKITLREALQHTYNILDGISVPAGLIQQIGVPVSKAMENLQTCIGVIDGSQAQATTEPAEDEDSYADA